MRFGFTTGSCAAAASKAAAYMLLTGREKEDISIETPSGIKYQARVEHIVRTQKSVSCCVQKDGGDDPDVTTGILIYAKVTAEAEVEGIGKPVIYIEAGEGIGRVTKPGLDQPVGSAAINRVPRQMINREVLEVCMLADFKGELRITLSVPGGEELARKTFNPRLGILGGISILGTTGIVEPMSTRALLETIRAELNVKMAQGWSAIAVSPGNYGLDFMRKAYGYDLEQSIKCSNFIGDTIDMAAESGVKELLLTGHIGKLIKVAGGIMNTHSREGDCRMELLASVGILAGIQSTTAKDILECVSTEGALKVLKEAGCLEGAMELVMGKICFYLEKRAAGRLNIQCIIYANEFGELAKSPGAEELLQKIKKS